MLITEGKVEVKEVALKRVINSCVVCGKSKGAKDLFKLVTMLAKIQSEINANYKGHYAIGLDELLTIDNKGDIIPFGGKILQRVNEL